MKIYLIYDEGPSDLHHKLAITLPCGHLYHAPCIRDWLERRQWCPLCKTVVV